MLLTNRSGASSGARSGMNVQTRFRLVFFDTARVARGMSDASRRSLQAAGKSMMYFARGLLRRHRRWRHSEMTGKMQAEYASLVDWARRHGRPKPKRPLKSSDPGKPPRVQPASPLKRLLFYSYDSFTQSVVVGPARFGGSQPPAPEVLEYGGVGRMWLSGKRRPVAVAPRPFMLPTLERERPMLPRRWANSIRRR